jgi:hypothetical protein
MLEYINMTLFQVASKMPGLAASFKKLFIFTKVYNSIFIMCACDLGAFFPFMPVSYYRSTLTTALNDNENRSTLYKAMAACPFAYVSLPQGDGGVSKQPTLHSSEPKFILAASTRSFLLLQRINSIPAC